MPQEDTTGPGTAGQNGEQAGLLATFSRSVLWRENLRTRVLVGVPALLAVLALTVFAPLVLLAAVVALAGAYGYYEYVRLVEDGHGLRLPRRPLVLAGLLVGLGAIVGTHAALGGALFVGTLLVVGALWVRPPARAGEGLFAAGAALAGLILVPWFLGHLALLLRLPGGRSLAAFLVLVLVFNDTLAYLVGSLLGRRPLMPAVSPNKTVEGALGGVAGGILAGALSWLLLRWGGVSFSLAAYMVLGAALAVAGQAGDLLESKVKRLNHAEDSGRFLPGHGGLLDRADAFLLAGPVLYYLLVILG